MPEICNSRYGTIYADEPLQVAFPPQKRKAGKISFWNKSSDIFNSFMSKTYLCQKASQMDPVANIEALADLIVPDLHEKSRNFDHRRHSSENSCHCQQTTVISSSEPLCRRSACLSVRGRGGLRGTWRSNKWIRLFNATARGP